MAKIFRKHPITVRISIKPNQIIRILFFIGLAFIVIRLQDVLVLLFVSFIIMAATKPLALSLSKKFKLPEGIAITIVFIMIFSVLIAAIYFISRPLAEELGVLAQTIPQLSTNLVRWLDSIPLIHNYVDQNQLIGFFNDLFSNFVDQFNSILNTVGSALIGAFRGILLTLFTMIFAIYLFLEREGFKGFIIRLFQFDEVKFHTAFDRIESQLGAWVRGQLILAVTVGFFTYIGLFILGVDYALPLAILAAILEIIPIIGPIITSVIVTIVGLSISPLTGVLCLALGIVIQQLENNFLVPVIMKRAVGISPVVTIIALLVGQEILGIIGALIAIPFAAMLVVIINTYIDDRDNKLIAKKGKRNLAES